MVRHVHLDDEIVAAESLDDAPLRVALGPNQKMTIVRRQWNENVGSEEALVDDDQRLRRHRRPQLRRVMVLVRLIRTKLHRRQEMRAQSHQRYQSHQWISAASTVTVASSQA